jgi:Domain of unknown function (DUF4037)
LSESIIDASRDFFNEVVEPILTNEFPTETAQTAFGVFGYGSEVLGMDDANSTDHHWGIRINALTPDEIFRAWNEAMQEALSARLPDTWRGQSLREGLSGGRGLSLTSLEAHLTRTIGIDHPPETYAEWLSIPEEDIIHVVGGEVWYDPAGRFTAVREALKKYYPEPVRLRRIAHWCRYYSGMGTYALKRALLRNNEYYANITFTRALRLGVQLAFLLDRQYFPYDKWTLAYFERLPRMADRLRLIVYEAVRLSTSWDRKLELLDQMSDVLDASMVEDGILEPHPKFRGSPTSGYRLIERAYAEITKKLPDEIKTVVPVWDQIYFERFHSGYVNSLDMQTWESLLNLTREGEPAT